MIPERAVVLHELAHADIAGDHDEAMKEFDDEE